MVKRGLLLLLVVAAVVPLSRGQVCSEMEDCHGCLQHAQCSWCGAVVDVTHVDVTHESDERQYYLDLGVCREQTENAGLCTGIQFGTLKELLTFTVGDNSLAEKVEEFQQTKKPSGCDCDITPPSAYTYNSCTACADASAAPAVGWCQISMISEEYEISQAGGLCIPVSAEAQCDPGMIPAPAAFTVKAQFIVQAAECPAP